MKTMRWNAVAISFAVGAIITTVIACRSNQTVTDNRVQCGRNLKALRISVAQYRDDHDGDFPPSLKEALTNVDVGNINLLQCPATAAQSPSPTDASELLGYHYVDWSKRGIKQPPGDFPLIYDAALQNHGDGINVICIDGTLFWDSAAKWLNNFAIEHPSAKLPIPK